MNTSLNHGSILRLGTRGSPLALWQARHVATRLHALGQATELVRIDASGDCDLTSPIVALPSAAPFTDRIDRALMEGAIDIAVHSLKDLPLELPAKMVIGAILPRGHASESLVSRGGVTLQGLPPGSRVGTSSPRRRAQLLALRSDLQTVPLRGPVGDRVAQVRSGAFDAVVLATAGLERLGLLDVVSERFSIDRFLPAPGQAALAVTLRRDDNRVTAIVRRLNHAKTARACRAELALLRRFKFHDHVAVAAHATVDDQIILRARLMALDGTSVIDAHASGDDPEDVGRWAAERLVARHDVQAEQSV